MFTKGLVKTDDRNRRHIMATLKATATSFYVLPRIRESMTTIDSAVFYGKYGANQNFWGHYLRVDRVGNIEYADSTCVFADFAGIRRFEYIKIVGIVWQF